MKYFKQTIILILTLAIFIGYIPPVQAETVNDPPEEEETTEFVPKPLLGELKDYTEGYIQEEDLDLNYSMLLSVDMRNRMEQDILSVLNYEPSTDESVNSFIATINEYVEAGGLDCSYDQLQNNSLLAEKARKLGLEPTRTDLVEIIDTESNSSGYIFVVNKDAVAIYVQDEEGNGIANAMVTISWTEPGGQVHTKGQFTTGDPLPGAVAFDGLEFVDYINIDIQYAGYQAKTIIDKRVTLGGVLYYQLEKAEENSVYVRGVDIDGKDLVNEDTLLALVDQGTEPLSIRLILSATGNATLPSSVTLGDIETKRSIATRSDPSSYAFDANSKIYTFKGDFIKKGNILKEGDRLEFRFDGKTAPLPHVTVEDAAIQPGIGEGNLPLVGNNDKVNFTDVIGGTGVVSVTMNYLKVPITVGFFPEGGFIAVFSYEIESLTESYSSLFEESWRPKTRAEGESVLEPFKTSFWQQADRFKNGEGQIDRKNRMNYATDKNWKVSVSFSVYCTGIYNKKTGNFDGSIGMCFDLNAKGGITQYFLLTTPVVVVPFYAGFELYGNSKAAISVNFLWNGIGDGMSAVFSADHTMVSRYDVIVGLDFFVGVGLRGAANVELSGGGSFDFARVVGTVEDPKPRANDPTRFLIDAFTNLKVSVNIAFFSITAYKKTWGPWRLYDNYPDKIEERSFPEEEISYETIEFDLGATEEKAHLMVQGSEGTLDQYKMDTLFTKSTVNDVETLTLLSENTYGDNQEQMVMAGDRSALFRLLTMDGGSLLVYHLMNPETGEIMDYYSVVPMPDGNSPIEFHAVGNVEGLPYVYIAAVTADATVSDMAERANHTDVMGIIVDLHTGKLLYYENMTKTWDGYYYYPRAAGSGDQITVAYRHAKSFDLMDYSTAYMIPYNSTTPVLMGNGTLYTTGYIMRNEPTFFIINKRWTDVSEDDRKLVVDGFGGDGYYSEQNPRYHFEMDISDIKQRDNEEYISNWGFINGYNYCIIDGSLYYLEQYANNYDYLGYGLRFKKIEGTDNLVNKDSTYAFVLNNDATSLHLVTATEVIEGNMETGEYRIAGSTIKIYTLENHYESGQNIVKLHGPLEIFIEDADIHTFTAVYNTYQCQSKGLTLVYATTPEVKDLGNGKISYSDNLYQWQQNRERGMKTVGVNIPDFIVFSDQECITANIFYQNIGYAVEGPVKFRITDSSGKVLQEMKYNGGSYEKIGTEVEHYPEKLWPGDVGQCQLLIEVNPEWQANQIEEIIIEMTYPTDERMKSVVSVPLNPHKMSLTAKDVTINDKHYASLTVTNLSPEEMGLNKIAMEINYQDKDPEVVYIDVSRVMTDPDRDGYNLTVLLQQYWDVAEEQGIKYIRFYLLDAEGNVLTGEADTLYPVIEKDVEPAEIKYEVTEGAEGTWEKGSEEPYQLTVKRNIEDETCFDHFTGLQIDENELVLNTDYSAVSGSTVINLNPSYLETLEEGEHSVTVNYDDGVAETTLTIKAQEKDEPVEPVEPVEPPVDTGDTNNLALWIGLLSGSAALALLVTIFYLKRRNRE